MSQEGAGSNRNRESNTLVIKAIGDSHNWEDDYNTKSLDALPYYGGRVDLGHANTPAWSLMGGLKDGTNFGEYQLFAVQPEDDTFVDPICEEEVDSYVRVRIQASIADWVNIEEGAFAAKIWLDETGRPEIAGGVSNADGFIDIVGMVPAGKTFGVTLANVGLFTPDTDDGWPEEFDTWITQGFEPGGGVIIDFREDLQGTATNRGVQFSTQEGVEPEEAYWQYNSFLELGDEHTDPGSRPLWGGAQYWLDIPTGTYNVGVQQEAEVPGSPLGSANPGTPFVHYVPDVEIGPNAFFGPLGYDKDEAEWIPGNTIFALLGATEELEVEIDECGPYVGKVFLNVVDGFLVDDLSPGVFHGAPDDENGLVFNINKGFRWDLAVWSDEFADHHGDDTDAPNIAYQGEYYDNWFLVSLDFNAAAGDLIFDLCETGAQYITPTVDKDWDSAWLELTPPGGNLNERWFDIHNGYTRADLPYAVSPYPDKVGDTPREYESENVFVYAKAGCCGEVGCFEAFVELDNDEIDPRDCCKDQDDLAVGDERCGQKNTVYGFIPTVPCWNFELVDISEWYTCSQFPENCIEASYDPIFGDGPYTTDAGVSQLEYDVATLNGEVLHTRGPWMDDFGNEISFIRVDDKCVDTCASDCCDEGLEGEKDRYRYTQEYLEPQYLLIENVTGEVIVDVEGWETDPLGPITEIGRYMYIARLPHGYLNDIEGHEEWEFVCCDLTGPCEICPDDCEFGLDYCEVPHYADEVMSLYAISPTDVKMTRWSWSWVMAMYEWDLTNGVSPTMYAPTQEITRGQMAAFIARLMGDVYKLEPLGIAEQFSDVPADYIFADDILFIRDYGITDGYGDGTYGPENPVKRSEMAKFLQVTFKTLEAYLMTDVTWWDTTTNNVQPMGLIFEDVGVGTPLVQYIDEMFVDTLTDGCKVEDGDLFFCPDDAVTREQMAKFIMRAVQTDDVTKGFWPVLAPEK